MVMSASDVSSITMSARVAGIAISTRMSTGMTVHTISAKVLWWKFAAAWPAARRWRIME